MKEIKITEFPHVKIGSAENRAAATGCTVLLFGEGAPVGLSVRGGGPASRESELLKPLATASEIHAILLSGGSAFGLDAAGGVMRYLEERNIGYDVGITKVPLVCQSCIFDLTVGDPHIRPDSQMAYEACRNAEQGNYQDGSHGVGTGATVGKLLGMERCSKSGLGSYAIQVGQLMVGALVVVNALGDVFDWKTGTQVSGLRSEDGTALLSTVEEMLRSSAPVENKFVGNTTLGVVLTNARMDKHHLNKVAELAQNVFARAINPVHTSADGDSIYAVSLGQVEADPDLVGTLAAQVMAEAILRGAGYFAAQ